MDTLHIDKYYGSLAGMMKKYDAHARSDAFKGTSQADYEQWRKQTRQTLSGLLGLDRMESCDLTPVCEPAVTLENGITRQKIRIQTEPCIWMPMYILRPAASSLTENSRCFICPPGHQGAGKYSVAGRRDIPAVAKMIDFYNYDYGMQLALEGHTVFCPDCRGFGERRDEAKQTDTEADFLTSTCFQLAHMALPLGETVAGMCTWDLMRLIDYIEALGEFNMQTLSCLGFSGGGMQTLWLSAMDDRVRLAVISGYFYGYKDSLLVLNGNCSCNYVPNLWLHVDMCDIASLIAPRPLVIQSCRGDHLNGARGIANVLEQMEVLKNSYSLFGADSRLYHDICEGEHCWHGENIPSAIKTVLGGVV